MPSFLNTVRDIERLRQIALVLGRHGFGEIVQRTGLARVGRNKESEVPAFEGSAAPGAGDSRITFGARLRVVLQDLGPSFVKLGQILSTRGDLIPADIVEELKKLQDRVPPVDFAELREEVERELGAPIAEVFAEFHETPMASASIAQVHRAKLLVSSGEPPRDVVVKIQRPKIREVVERDVELLYFLAKAIERGIPESRIYSPVGLVTEFDRAISSELDFSREADNAQRFARNFDGDATARFPDVYRDSSGKKVLTLEFLDGKKPGAAIAAGFSGERLAKVSLGVIFKQIFEHGFFHADPHPGNILILGTPESPVLGLIDLGLVGRLSPQLRDKTVDLMVAASRQDAKGVADALYSIGIPTRRINRERYDAEVTMLAEKYLGKPLKEIEISFLISDIVRGAVKYGLEIPPDFLMLARTLMTIEGVGKEIYPDLDVFSEVRPYFLRLVMRRYSPDRVAQEALRMLDQLGATAAGIPPKIDDVLDDLRRGDLVVRTKDDELPRAVDLLGRRIFGGLVIASAIFSASMLLGTARWEIAGQVLLGAAALYFGAHVLRGYLRTRKL